MATATAIRAPRTRKRRAVSPAMELARRDLAKVSLIDFCAYVDPGAGLPGARDPFVENWYRAAHLKLIASYIERAERGELWRDVPGKGKKILLITTPPGHWKSSLVSRKLPAWFVGKRYHENRPHSVILTSYNASLAQMNNARVLELVRSHRYQNVFPLEISYSSQSSEQWSVDGVPYISCVARGVGGGLTGYHAAMAIVDDPIKDRKDANSATVRQNLWDWWKDVLRTRLVDDESFILGIWTRWSEDDPAGRLAAEQAAGTSDERIVLLRLPALAETEAERESAAKLGLPVDAADPLGRAPGEALWPERESAEEHAATRRAYPLTFDSLYQGRPRPAGGYLVGEGQFHLLPALPTRHVRWVWATDWAITQAEVAPKKTDPDYTAIGLIGLWTPNGPDEARLVIGFMRRGQLDTHNAKQMVKETILGMEQRYPVRAGQDNIDKVVLAGLRRDPELLNFSIRSLNLREMSGDKVVKSQPWMELVHAGAVYVVQGPWNDEFFREVENFPNGTHDDQVDVVSVGAHALGLARRHPEKKAKSYQG